MKTIAQLARLPKRNILIAFTLAEGGAVVWHPRRHAYEWHAELPPTIRIGAITFQVLDLGLAGPELMADVARTFPRGPDHVTATAEVRQ